MKEPIQTRIRLRCTIQKSGFGQPAFKAITEELARDYAIVLVEVNDFPDWFRPGQPIVAGIELPVRDGRSASVLECVGRVWIVRRDGARMRASFDIVSMAFTKRMP